MRWFRTVPIFALLVSLAISQFIIHDQRKVILRQNEALASASNAMDKMHSAMNDMRAAMEAMQSLPPKIESHHCAIIHEPKSKGNGRIEKLCDEIQLSSNLTSSRINTLIASAESPLCDPDTVENIRVELWTLAGKMMARSVEVGPFKVRQGGFQNSD